MPRIKRTRARSETREFFAPLEFLQDYRHPQRASRFRWASRVCGVALALLFVTPLALDRVTTTWLPSLQPLHDYSPAQTTRVLSHDGRLVGQLFRERRTVVPIENVPQHVIRAFLAAEDASFYEHGGLDFPGILRAAFKNLRASASVQGASTITQQTIKRLMLGPERTYTRKIKEALLARRLEKELSKDGILEIYLNDIYLSAGAYGVEEAAQTYFGKSVRGLSLLEGATLASIPKSPTRFHPIRNPEAVMKRRARIVEQMHRHDWATDEDLQAAQREPLALAPRNADLDTAPHYVAQVRRLLIEKFGEELTYTGGLEVIAGVDVDLQRAAHARLRAGLEALSPGDAGDRPEGAFVAIDPRTRSVHAIVGGYDLDGDNLNRATQSRRQPGSAMKPIVYAAALADHVITPASLCADAPVTVHEDDGTWRPTNYNSHQYSGLISYRTALMRSVNTCSIRLTERLGAKRVIEMAHALGIEAELPEDLTVGLGSGDLSPLELATAYSTIAAGGDRAKPLFIHTVVAPSGEIIHTATTDTVSALEPAVAYVLTSMMHSVVEGGTASAARAVGRPLAGKTGTSNDGRNTWFSGFSPDLVATVWVGYDDNRPQQGRTGGSAALPIWTAFMGDALADRPVRDFVAPSGVSYVRIDPLTGERVEEPHGEFELFVAGTEPAAIGAGRLQSVFLLEDSSS